MKQTILLLMPILGACGGGDGNETGGGKSSEPVQIADLIGLYEARGEGRQRGRMCMVSAPSGATSFGIVTQTADAGSCSGAGEAARQSNILRLTMGGDGECVIEGQIAGTQVTLPASLPEGCAYYCAPGASLAGATFEKTGGTAKDAMRAPDLAGDPLCG